MNSWNYIELHYATKVHTIYKNGSSHDQAI